MSEVAEKLNGIKTAIADAANVCGRDPASVQLVAVSKKQPPERIQEALDAGHRLFGENRVQEAYEHWADLKERYPDLRLHLIGPLQTNKAKDAVALFDCIETVDRVKLAKALAQEMESQGRKIPCLIQVNSGEEPQKHGVLPRDLPVLLEQCRALGLDIRGLMCIPPIDEPAALHFAFLSRLAKSFDLPELSIGMSNDYERAIPLGATYVRVGTAVFGPRPVSVTG